MEGRLEAKGGAAWEGSVSVRAALRSFQHRAGGNKVTCTE